jgi:hypothetical protein
VTTVIREAGVSDSPCAASKSAACHAYRQNHERILGVEASKRVPGILFGDLSLVWLTYDDNNFSALVHFYPRNPVTGRNDGLHRFGDVA